MRHRFFSIILLFSFVAMLAPRVSEARPLWYGLLARLDGDTAYLQIGGLEKKHYFSCGVTTLACQQLPDTFDPKKVVLSTPPVAHRSSLHFPKKATRNTISQSGKYGAYLINDTASRSRIYAFINGKTNKRYTVVDKLAFWDLSEEQLHVFQFAPDDSRVAYVSDRSGFMSIYLAPLSSMSNSRLKGTAITSGVSVGDFMFTDANTILYIANTKADPYNWVLYSYNINTKTSTLVSEHLAYDDLLHPSGNSIIFNVLTPLGTMPMVLTNTGEVKAFNIPLTPPQYTDKLSYSYQKLGDTNMVVIKDPNSRSLIHPLIVWLHGGPYRQTSFYHHAFISYGVYDWMLEEAATAGATILKVDYTGSYGAGRAYTQNIKNAAGKLDVADVKNVVDDFLRTNNPNGVYLVGNSYGGYLGLRTIVEYPDMFKGVLSINGVTDWGVLLADMRNSIFNEFFNGVPKKSNKKLYAQASILDKVSVITNQKIDIIQAAKDRTVNPRQAQLAQDAFYNQGKVSSLLFIPEEDHVFKKDASMNTICQHLFNLVGFDPTNKCNLAE